MAINSLNSVLVLRLLMIVFARDIMLNMICRHIMLPDLFGGSVKSDLF